MSFSWKVVSNGYHSISVKQFFLLFLKTFYPHRIAWWCGGLRSPPGWCGSYYCFALFRKKLLVCFRPSIVYMIDQGSGLSFYKEELGLNLENILYRILWVENWFWSTRLGFLKINPSPPFWGRLWVCYKVASVVKKETNTAWKKFTLQDSYLPWSQSPFRTGTTGKKEVFTSYLLVNPRKCDCGADIENGWLQSIGNVAWNCKNAGLSFGLSCLLFTCQWESILSENIYIFLRKVCDTVVELCCCSNLNSLDICWKHCNNYR